MYGLPIADKSGDLASPLTYMVKVMFSVLVLKFITQPQIALGVSNIVEGFVV